MAGNGGITGDDCPGCLDCDSPVMQAEASGDQAPMRSTSAEPPPAVLEARFPGYSQAPIILKTGPPDDPPFVHETPITLKQRQLI